MNYFKIRIGITWRNVQETEDKTYIVAKSLKTDTNTRIKLPQYAIDILFKYKKRKTIFASISLNQFNKNKILHLTH